MKKDFSELEKQIRVEVLSYLIRGGVDLSNHDAVHGALDNFYSDTIVKYMDDNGLELGYMFNITEDNNITVDIWEW